MSMNALSAWLDEKLAGVPEELAREVRHLVLAETGIEPGPDVVSRLASSALRGLDEVAVGSRDREVALRLLAADAALTYAFEAAAELGGDVGALAGSIGLHGELGARIAATSADGMKGSGE
jgi:hypothetical protein